MREKYGGNCVDTGVCFRRCSGKGLVLRDVAVQRLYWLVSGQGYGDSGKGAKVFENESILARGFNPIGQQSKTPDNIFREQALFINYFTRAMGISHSVGLPAPRYDEAGPI